MSKVYLAEIRSWYDFRGWLCGKGLHWPITWTDSAYPGSYDPPEPPEPGWACEWCGYVREPYRWWWWEMKRLVWLATHSEWAGGSLLRRRRRERNTR